MGLFSFKQIPERWDARWVMETLLALRQALNQLSTDNFPNRLNGDTLIEKRTVGLDRLSRGQISVGTFLALAVTYTTTSTSLVQIGPLLPFDPLDWPYAPEQFFFRVTAGPAAAGANAIIELWDAGGVIASITTPQTVGQAYYEAVLIRLPVGTLSLKIRTSLTTVAAGILGASVVFKP